MFRLKQIWAAVLLKECRDCADHMEASLIVLLRRF